MESLSDGIVMIIKLENWLQVSCATIFEDVTRENPTDLIRPMKVQICKRLCMMQGGSLYITDHLLNRPPFNYTAQRLSSP